MYNIACAKRPSFIQVAALKGYKDANMNALKLWEETYPNNLFVALTDTFSTKVFFQARPRILSLSSKPYLMK